MLSDDIGRHIELVRKGMGDRYYQWVEHDSFVVDNEKGLWHWYSRDQWGDYREFCKLFGYPHQAKEPVAAPKPKREIHPLDARPYANLHRSLMNNRTLQSFIRERYSLELPVMRLAKLGYSSKLDCISIPNFSGGSLFSARFRRVASVNRRLRYFSAKGSRPIFPYGLNMLGPNRDLLFVVEGEMKCLAVLQLGYNCISTAGTSFMASWVKYLSDFSRVVHIRDRDHGGMASSVRIKKMYPSVICTVTDDVKSIDDLAVKNRDDACAFLGNFGQPNYDIPKFQQTAS